MIPTRQAKGSKKSPLHRAGTYDPALKGTDIRFRTNFATKPDPVEDGATTMGDPMEFMVELPKGGYDLARFVSKEGGS